jgi:hypothetical protein
MFLDRRGHRLQTRNLREPRRIETLGLGLWQPGVYWLSRRCNSGTCFMVARLFSGSRCSDRRRRRLSGHVSWKGRASP